MTLRNTRPASSCALLLIFAACSGSPQGLVVLTPTPQDFGTVPVNAIGQDITFTATNSGGTVTGPLVGLKAGCTPVVGLNAACVPVLGLNAGCVPVAGL